MEAKVGFLEEAPNQKSSMRLFSLILLIFFCLFNGLYALQKDCAIDFNFIFYNTIILTGVFAPKYFQKIAELKLGTLDNQTPPPVKPKTDG